MAIQETRKSKKQRALQIALRFILKKDILNKRCLRDGYGLCPQTINKIEAGKSIQHSREKYFDAFFDIIDNYRCRYEGNDDQKCLAAKEILFDMALLQMGKQREAERLKNKLLKTFMVH